MDNNNNNNQELTEEQKKEKLKTNKKIVLTEDPVEFVLNEVDDPNGASVTLQQEPTAHQATEVNNDEPQVQTGTITF